MKTGSVVALFSGLIVIGGGLGGAYWYGNQPLKETYPDGSVKSITERKMYENTGKYQLFAQDGSKILECNQEKGVKVGKGEIFFSGGSVEFNYRNGKLNGPLTINSKKFKDYVKDIDLNIESSELKLSSGENVEVIAGISCKDDDFVVNMREFLNVQDYDNFKNFFACLNFNKATFTMNGGKCTYEGEYQFPRYLSDSKSVCEINNAEFLDGYTEGFNKIIDLSSDLTSTDGAVSFSAGHLSNITDFKFETDYSVSDNKFKFISTTSSENAKIKQEGSFGGFEKIIESTAEFLFSSQEEADIKKIVSSLLQNMTWSDWKTVVNGHKRFVIKGDFNFMKGFSDPYLMSYYSNNEVTTQWKIDAKGSQLISKYPNTNIPLFSFGIGVNDGFKKAYKTLIQDGLSMSMLGSPSFDPAVMVKLQDDATALIRGINSFSSVLMNNRGEKTVSGVAMIEKNFSIDQFMASPMQFLNFKITTYQDNKPFKVYEGNPVFGFKLNGKTLPAEQYGVEAEYLIGVVQDSFEGIMSELEKVYGDIDETDVSWIDADIDPFLFGLYKGYTTAKEQFGVFDEENDDEDATIADEISMIITNTKIAFSGNPDSYQNLNNASAVELGLVSLYDDNNMPMNSFMGKVVFKASGKSSENSGHDAFIVALSGIPDEDCAEFLSYGIDMLPQDGIIGVAVGNMNVAPKGFSELNKIKTDSTDNDGNSDASQGFIATKATVYGSLLTEENIEKICSGDKRGNFIAVKYY